MIPFRGSLTNRAPPVQRGRSCTGSGRTARSGRYSRRHLRQAYAWPAGRAHPYGHRARTFDRMIRLHVRRRGRAAKAMPRFTRFRASSSPSAVIAPRCMGERHEDSTEGVAMATIRQQDLIASVADALQYISYYHPIDYIEALGEAYAAEQSPAAKDAIAQILTNSKMCAEGHRPICQDTGIVTVFLKVGMDVHFNSKVSLQEMIDEGVRRAYTNPDNTLRASILADPAGKRLNTKDNTPAVVNVSLVPGNKVDVIVAAKGGGSEAKSKFAMLNPSDSIVEWVLKTVPTMGAGWCPPCL